MTETNETKDNSDDLPGWVQFWVSPSRKPALTLIVLAISLVITWLGFGTCGVGIAWCFGCETELYESGRMMPRIWRTSSKKGLRKGQTIDAISTRAALCATGNFHTTTIRAFTASEMDRSCQRIIQLDRQTKENSTST